LTQRRSLDHHGLLTLAATSTTTCQPCASSNVYGRSVKSMVSLEADAVVTFSAVYALVEEILVNETTSRSGSGATSLFQGRRQRVSNRRTFRCAACAHEEMTGRLSLQNTPITLRCPVVTPSLLQQYDDFPRVAIHPAPGSKRPHHS
jgi:hypothetical protein